MSHKRQLNKNERQFFIIMLMAICQLLLQIAHGIGIFNPQKENIQQLVDIGQENAVQTRKSLEGVVTNQQKNLALIGTDQLIEKRGWKESLATKPLGIIEEANTLECDRGSKPTYDEYDKQIICMTAESLNTDCISPEGSILKEGQIFIGFKPGDKNCEKEERLCQQGQLKGDKQYILSSCSPTNTTDNDCVQKDGTIIPENNYTVLFEDPIVDKDQNCNFVESICKNGKLDNKYGFKADSCQFTNSFSTEYITTKPRIINEKGEIDKKYLEISTQTQNTKNCKLPRGNILAHGESVYTFKQARVPFEEFCTFSIVECDDGVFLGGQVYQYPDCQIGGGKDCSLQGKTIKDGETITAYKQGDLEKNGNYICPEIERTCTNGELKGDESYNLTICRLGEVGKARCQNPRGGTAIEHNKEIIAYQTATVPYGENCNAIAEKRICNNGTLGGSYKYQSCSTEKGQSCTTPWGTTLKDGEKTKAYKKPSYNFSEDCNNESMSEWRSCENGTLKGSYTYGICNKQEPKGCQLPDATIMQHGAVVTLYQYNEVYGEAEDGVDICPRQVRKCNDGNWIDFDNKKNPFSFKYKQCNVIPPSRQ